MTAPDDADGAASGDDADGALRPSTDEQVAARRLHPLTPAVTLVLSLMRGWPVLLLGVARGAWVLLAVLVAAVVAWSALAWAFTTYAIGPDGLVVRSGVLWRNVQAVPPQRVQQVEVRRQLRHRAVGLAAVRVGLAGGGERAQVDLDALARADARRLAATLERWRSGAGAAGLDQAGPDELASAPAPAPVHLLRLSTGQLVVAGLTSRSLWLAPFAALAAFVQFMSDTRVSIDTADTVRSTLAQASPAVVLAVAMLAGLAIAAVGSVLTHHGLEVLVIGRRGAPRRPGSSVDRPAGRPADPGSPGGPLSEQEVDDRELVVTRGLFDQRTVTIPRARVQFVELRAHLVRRRLGLASLQIRTADLGGASGDGTSATSIPIGPRDDLAALVPELVPEAAATVSGDGAGAIPTRRHPPAAVRRSVIRGGLRLVPATAAFGAVVGGIGAAPIAAIVGAVVAVPTGWLAGRRLRSGWTDTCIATERGLFGWRRTVVPVRRVQSVGLVQNPFQRRLGLATARLDVAGSVRGVELVDLAVTDAERLPALIRMSARIEAGDDRTATMKPAAPAQR